MKYYVFSDIHGYCKKFKKMLGDSGYYEDRNPHKIIILGDLFDRGTEALELQDFILKLMANDEVILIKGNHEDLYRDLVTVDQGLAFDHHISNGTFDTALQLSGFDRRQCTSKCEEFAAAARQVPYFTDIIPNMLDYYETEHYVFVHGWIPCIAGRSGYTYIEEWRDSSPGEWENARWYNGMDAAQTANEGKTVLCGHWHASYGHARYEHKGSEFGTDADFSPYYGPGVIALDACTAYSGIVNCVIIDD